MFFCVCISEFKRKKMDPITQRILENRAILYKQLNNKSRDIKPTVKRVAMKRASYVSKKRKNQIELFKARLKDYNEMSPSPSNDDPGEKEFNEKKVKALKTIANELIELKTKKKPKKKKTTTNQPEYLIDETEEDLIAIEQQKRKTALTTINVKVLQNERNKRISLIGGKEFHVDGKRYKGLTNMLKETIWPMTSDNPFNKDPDEVKRRKAHKKYTPSEKLSKRIDTCKGYGHVHGSQVHLELQSFTNHAIRSNNMMHCLEQIHNPDPCTLKFIYFFMEKKWIPIASEFNVFDETLHMATAIDLLLVDTINWELVLVELKTGFDGESYEAHPTDEFFGYPFQELENCPMNRHQLQLLFQKLLLKKRYDYDVKQCYVLRASARENKLLSYPMIGWSKKNKNQKAFYDHLKRYTL